MCSKGVRVQKYMKKRGSAWWDEEIKEMVREKRRLFKIYITDRNERNREEYRQKSQEVKKVIGQKKNEVDERDGIQLTPSPASSRYLVFVCLTFFRVGRGITSRIYIGSYISQP